MGMTLLNPCSCWNRAGFTIDELGLQDGLDLGLQLVELVLVVGEYGDIDADVEEVLLGLHQLVAQLFQVLIGRVQGGIAHQALLFPPGDLALDFGDFLLEMAQNLGRVHGMDEYGDVEDLVQVDDGREPALVQEARIGDDEKSTADLLAQVELLRADFEGRRSYDILQFQDAGLIYLFRQDGDYWRSLFFLEYIADE